MPLINDHVILVADAVQKLVEVNPERQVLKITNWSPMVIVVADDDEPLITEGSRMHGIVVPPYATLTLEEFAGDKPERAWWAFCYYQNAFLMLFEGMRVPERRKWW